jgi:hypothetical protein
MLQSHNYTDPFDSKAVLAFLTLVGIAFCEFVIAASLLGLFQGVAFLVVPCRHRFQRSGLSR